MADDAVECAVCKRTIPAAQADVVTFGSGYRCPTCTMRFEAVAHEAASQAAWQQQDPIANSRFWIRLGIVGGAVVFLFLALFLRLMLRG